MRFSDHLPFHSRRAAFFLLLAAVCLATLPFLGLTDFNTKGEPREAVVAYSMLAQNDWILPANNGGEIPYKPPFFHWCVALAALLTGGEVTEYVSRLPSAIALICMTSAVYLFISRRRTVAEGFLTALVTFTAFEVYRAGMNCRVDMMLAALTVGALISLYGWWERGMRGLPWTAVLLMSCATLTKGPVGIIIPCMAGGVFMLMRGARFLPLFLRLFAAGLLSLILPLGWYAGAYARGGETFLALVLEENFGRMTGTMAYESHLNPWYYNILTLLAGFLPWTVAALTALFLIKRGEWRRAFTFSRGRIGSACRRLLRGTDAVQLFALVCSAVIFIFYCIPASKRSVYLLPMYPFTAYFVARLLIWMTRRRRGSVAGLGDALAVIGLLLFAAFVSIRAGAVPASIFGHGRHAAANAAMLESLAVAGGFMAWFWAVISVCVSILWFCRIRKVAKGTMLPAGVGAVTVALYLAFSGAFQPAVLNARSMKPMARELANRYPDIKDNIYEFIAVAEEAKGNPIHYFELDFYLGDPVRNFRRERPAEGYLLTGTDDAAEWLPRFREEGYEFELLRAPEPRQPRHTPALYRFSRQLRQSPER